MIITLQNNKISTKSLYLLSESVQRFQSKERHCIDQIYMADT